MSAPLLQFRVAGLPVPQGSKIPQMSRHKDPNKRVPMLREDSPKLKAWRDKVKHAARIALMEAGYPPPLEGPIRVVMLFALHKPAHGKYSRPIGKNHGDWEKLARAVDDACTEAKVWGDDAQVTDGRAVKDYPGPRVAQTSPGVIVRIWRADDDPLPPPSSGQTCALPTAEIPGET